MTYSDCVGYIVRVSDNIELRSCQPDGGSTIASDIWVQSYTGSVLLTDDGAGTDPTKGTFSAHNSASITNNFIRVEGISDVKIKNVSLYADRDITVSEDITISSSDGGVTLETQVLYTNIQDLTAQSIAITGRGDVKLSQQSLNADQSLTVSDDIRIASTDGGVTLDNSVLRADNRDLTAQSIAITGQSDILVQRLSFYAMSNLTVSDDIRIASSHGGVTLNVDALCASSKDLTAQSIAITGRGDVTIVSQSLYAGQNLTVSDTITIASSDGGVTLDTRVFYATRDISVPRIDIRAQSDIVLSKAALFTFLETLQVSDIRIASTAGAIRLGRVSSSFSQAERNSFYAGADGSLVGRVTFVAEELNLRDGPGMSGIYNDGGVITIDFCGVKRFTGTGYENFFQVSGFGKAATGSRPNNTTDRLHLYVSNPADKALRDALIQSALQQYDATIFCCSTSGCSDGCYSDAAGCLLCTPGNYCTGQVQTPCPAGTYNPWYGASACIPCPAGTYNPSDGSTSLSSCLPCAAGFASSDGATLCQPVPTTEPEPQVPAVAPDPLRLLLLFLLYWLGLFLLLLVLLEALL